jgi:hypothetical protein
VTLTKIQSGLHKVGPTITITMLKLGRYTF